MYVPFMASLEISKLGGMGDVIGGDGIEDVEVVWVRLSERYH